METVGQRLRAAQPVLPRRLEQTVGTHNIGFDKSVGAGDGPVHMALRGEMHQGIHGVLPQQREYLRIIADIGMREVKSGGAFQPGEIRAIAGVGERIQRHNAVIRMALAPVVDKVGADKAGGAGHQQ